MKSKELAEILMKNPEALVFLYDDATSDAQTTHTKRVIGVDSSERWNIIVGETSIGAKG